MSARFVRGWQMRTMTQDPTGDMARFYDILLPFMTGKPLEQSLIETELVAELIPTGEDPALVERLLMASANDEEDDEEDDEDDGEVGEKKEEEEQQEEATAAAATTAAVVAGGIGGALLAAGSAHAAASSSSSANGKNGKDSKKKDKVDGKKGPWRLPERSATSYVRCIFEAVNFLLVQGVGKDKALPQLCADQVCYALAMLCKS